VKTSYVHIMIVMFFLNVGEVTFFGLVRVLSTGVISYSPTLWNSLINGYKILDLHWIKINYNYIVSLQVG
jgi:hypothetical protein